MVCQSLIRPGMIRARETVKLTNTEEEKLRIFEKEVNAPKTNNRIALHIKDEPRNLK